MTKRDYVAIGNALRYAEFDSQGFTSPRLVIRTAAHRIADVFETDNPRFDRQRFLQFVEIGQDNSKNGHRPFGGDVGAK